MNCESVHPPKHLKHHVCHSPVSNAGPKIAAVVASLGEERCEGTLTQCRHVELLRYGKVYDNYADGWLLAVVGDATKFFSGFGEELSKGLCYDGGAEGGPGSMTTIR
jgi:hypothetical protein